MTADLSTIITPLAGGFAVGFAIGYFVRKVVKWLIVIFGAYMAGVLYMQSVGWFSVNWTKITADTQSTVGRLVSAETTGSIQTALGNIGLPLGAGLTGGLIVGFNKG